SQRVTQRNAKQGNGQGNTECLAVQLDVDASRLPRLDFVLRVAFQIERGQVIAVSVDLANLAYGAPQSGVDPAWVGFLQQRVAFFDEGAIGQAPEFARRGVDQAGCARIGPVDGRRQDARTARFGKLLQF